MIRRLLCSVAVAGFAVLGWLGRHGGGQQDSGGSCCGATCATRSRRGRRGHAGARRGRRARRHRVRRAPRSASSRRMPTGQFELPLPGPDDYTVRSTSRRCPTDVDAARRGPGGGRGQRPPDRAPGPQLLPGSGSAARPRAGGTQLPQTIANGIKFGLIIAITAIGLSLIYGTTGLSNFAHGELVTLGAIVAWWMNQSVGLHLLRGDPVRHRRRRARRASCPRPASGDHCAARASR